MIELMDLVGFSEIVNFYCNDASNTVQRFEQERKDFALKKIQETATVTKTKKEYEARLETGFIYTFISSFNYILSELVPTEISDIISEGRNLISSLSKVRSENQRLIDFAFVKDTYEFVDIGEEMFSNLLGRIENANKEFNDNLTRLLGTHERIEGGEIPADFELDLELFNYSLEQLPKTPYSKENVFYAVKVCQGYRGVEGYLQNAVARLTNLIAPLKRNLTERDVDQLLTELGFKFTLPEYCSYKEHYFKTYTKTISGPELVLRRDSK